MIVTNSTTLYSQRVKILLHSLLIFLGQLLTDTLYNSCNVIWLDLIPFEVCVCVCVCVYVCGRVWACGEVLYILLRTHISEQ